jgi:hypothetical protein
MKKTKPARKALRELKHEKKLAANASFQDVLKASASHANKVGAKKKGKKGK